jgi:hypothetical protein
MSDLKSRIQNANAEVVRRMTESRPLWVDVRRAGDVIPGLHRALILHAGPPIPWDRMCAPQRSAVCGAAVYEGLAPSVDEAAMMVTAGSIALAPCHEHRAVGSMCGVTSFSMPVLVVRNETFGTEAYCHLYEHPDREKLSYGTYSPRVHENLKWLEDVLAPALQGAIRGSGGLDIRSLIARSLTMGDECHSRNFAGTALLVTEIAPYLAVDGMEPQTRAAVMDFLRRSTQFALHLVMAACKTVADAAAGVEYSSIVTAMARNGVETGIRVSGLGDRWFTGPAGEIIGLFFAGYGPSDAQADLGDSAITETVGLGAFAHAASPALALVKSPSAMDALQYTDQMRAITAGVNANFAIPYLDARGTPTGIDIRLVVETGTTPIINTAAADRRGRGQIGVGNARAPMDAFRQALRAFGARYA